MDSWPRIKKYIAKEIGTGYAIALVLAILFLVVLYFLGK